MTLVPAVQELKPIDYYATFRNACGSQPVSPARSSGHTPRQDVPLSRQLGRCLMLCKVHASWYTFVRPDGLSSYNSLSGRRLYLSRDPAVPTSGCSSSLREYLGIGTHHFVLDQHPVASTTEFALHRSFLYQAPRPAFLRTFFSCLPLQSPVRNKAPTRNPPPPTVFSGVGIPREDRTRIVPFKQYCRVRCLIIAKGDVQWAYRIDQVART
jgi:hypothetical protein